jgi:CBS domain-containing protein
MSMRVQDIMKRLPATTTVRSTLADVGRQMATIGCGIVPVVDEQQRLVGVVTDRDLCLALSHANVPASDLTVSAAMTAPPHTCREHDDLESALEKLGRHRVRRLPVVDDFGRVAGLFSLDDAALRYSEVESRTLGASIARALRAICEPALPAVR